MRLGTKMFAVAATATLGLSMTACGAGDPEAGSRSGAAPGGATPGGAGAPGRARRPGLPRGVVDGGSSGWSWWW